MPRIRISLENPGEKLLPINYQYPMAAAVYSKLESTDPDIHDARGPRNHSFSLLFGDGVVPMASFIFFRNAEMIFTAWDPSLVSDLAKRLRDEPLLTLEDAPLIVKDVRDVPPVRTGEEEEFITLSPVHIRSRGRENRRDLYPDSPDFAFRLEENLTERWRVIAPSSTGPTRFEIVRVEEIARKRIKILNTFWRATLMAFRARGTRELLQLAYDGGLGDKCAMGFGCLEILRGGT